MFAAVFDAAVTTDITCNTAIPVITKISFANYDEDSSADSLSSAKYDEGSFAAVTLKTISYESDTNDNDDSTNDEATFTLAVIYKYILTLYESPSAVITKTTAPHTLHSMQCVVNSSPSVLYDKNASAITMTTSPSSYQSPCGNIDNYCCDATVSTSVIFSLKIYDTVYNLNFDTTFDTTFAIAFNAAVTTDITCNTAVPIITKISFADYEKDSSADSLSTAVHDGIISADNNVVSSTTVTIMTTAVSVADEATSVVTKTLTVSCHSLNYFPLILPFESSRQFDRITSVLSHLDSTVASQDNTLDYNFSSTFDF